MLQPEPEPEPLIDPTSEQSPDAPPESQDKKSASSSKSKTQGNYLFSHTEQYQLALFMRQCVLKNLPNAKVPDATPEGFRRWAYDIDLMMRVDHRRPDEIRQLIDLSNKDSFWRANILSPGKLREKWDTLVAHRMRDVEKPGGSRLQITVGSNQNMVVKA